MASPLANHADAAVYCGSNDDVMISAIRAIEEQAATEALERAFAIGDELDSNHARWAVQRTAEERGLSLALPPVNEPNNRLREQLAECQEAATEARRELDVERFVKAMRVVDTTTRQRVVPYADMIAAEYRRLIEEPR